MEETEAPTGRSKPEAVRLGPRRGSLWGVRSQRADGAAKGEGVGADR